MKKSVLLAVDDSEASERASAYLAEWAGPDVSVFVVHALRQPIGLSAVATEAAPSRSQERFESAREEAQPSLLRAVERLKENGVDPGSIDDGMLYVAANQSAADGLIELARQRDVDTIVVGRNALPWHRELFHRHLADELVEKVDGVALWVVE